MELLTDLLIALALAMDAFSVSVSGGATLKETRLRDGFVIASYFGAFQLLMTLAGWQGAVLFGDWIEDLDHWLAFSLLILIGGKMIYESLKKHEEAREFYLNCKLLLVLAIATSIDALGVGLSFAFLDKEIMQPAILIGLVTFVLSGLGFYLGKKLKKILGGKAEFFGGIILIVIGIKILLEHLG